MQLNLMFAESQWHLWTHVSGTENYINYNMLNYTVFQKHKFIIKHKGSVKGEIILLVYKNDKEWN